MSVVALASPPFDQPLVLPHVAFEDFGVECGSPVRVKRAFIFLVLLPGVRFALVPLTIVQPHARAFAAVVAEQAPRARISETQGTGMIACGVVAGFEHRHDRVSWKECFVANTVNATYIFPKCQVGAKRIFVH
jgi:hypothetical protein